MGLFADDQSEDENWLQEHNKEFQSPGASGVRGARGWKEQSRDETESWKSRAEQRRQRIKNLRQAKRTPQTKRPIQVGKTKQMCPHCKEEAAVELFRDTKCLACQAADFLGPIH